jgi:hypothetical protein
MGRCAWRVPARFIFRRTPLKGLTRLQLQHRRSQGPEQSLHRAVADAQAAPVAAANDDGRRDVLHQGEDAAAEIAAIGLQQVGPRVAAGGQPDAVVEQAPVAAVGVVPLRIGAGRSFIGVARCEGSAVTGTVGRRR